MLARDKNSRFSTTAECSRLMTNFGYRTWADDGVGAVNDVHSRMARPCMSGQLYMTQVTEATSKTICPKKHFAPHLKNPKDIATKKVNKPMYGTKLYHRVNFHADQHEISVLWQKIHIFLIGDCTGRLPSMLYIFGKLSSSQCYAPFDMRLFSIHSRSKFEILEQVGGIHKAIRRVWDRYPPSCKISRRLVSPSPRYL